MWESVGNIKGPVGSTGPQGEPGVWNAEVATTAQLGAVLSSTAEGFGSVNPATGVVSVNGWAAMVARIRALEVLAGIP